MTNLLLWPLSRICSVTLQRVILTRKEENKDHRIASSIDSFRVWPLPAQQKMHDTQMQIGRNLDRTVYCKWEKQRSLPKQKEGTHARTHARLYIFKHLELLWQQEHTHRRKSAAISPVLSTAEKASNNIFPESLPPADLYLCQSISKKPELHFQMNADRRWNVIYLWLTSVALLYHRPSVELRCGEEKNSSAKLSNFFIFLVH